MIVLQLDPEEAQVLGGVVLDLVAIGAHPLVAWDPIDRAIKVKGAHGAWSPPIGKVIADD